MNLADLQREAHAIEAKLEYSRTRSYRHGGKVL